MIGFRKGNKKALESLRKEAVERKHWETWRDIDRVEAVAKRDTQLLAHLYYGTPFPIFRESLMKVVKGWVPPESYQWKMGKGKGEILKVWAGKKDGNEDGLKEGQAVHRLLVVLASDFYRPFRTATLCNLLYPEEHFHPEHSPTKLRQILVRLREWLEEQGLKLSVLEENGGYRLHHEGDVTLELVEKVHTASRERPNVLLDQLREKFPLGFGTAEAAKASGLNPRALQRLLEKGIESGLIARVGKGKNTRYEFEDELTATGTGV